MAVSWRCRGKRKVAGSVAPGLLGALPSPLECIFSLVASSWGRFLLGSRGVVMSGCLRHLRPHSQSMLWPRLSL